MFQLVGCQASIHYVQRWQIAYHSSINTDIPSTKKPNTGPDPFLFSSAHGLLKEKVIVGPFGQHLDTRHTWRPFSATQQQEGE